MTKGRKAAGVRCSARSDLVTYRGPLTTTVGYRKAPRRPKRSSQDAATSAREWSDAHRALVLDEDPNAALRNSQLMGNAPLVLLDHHKIGAARTHVLIRKQFPFRNAKYLR